MAPESPPRPDHWRGVGLVTGAAFAWACQSPLIRLVSVDDWTVVFWAHLFMMPAVLAIVARRHGPGALGGAFRAIGPPGVVASVTMGLAWLCFVLALHRTSVANTVVLMSTTPFWAALLGWLVLGERPGLAALGAMAVAFGGIVVMFADSLARGTWFGDLLALAAGLSYGVNLIALRSRPRVDMLPTTFIGGGLTVLVIWPWASPASAGMADIALLAAVGVFCVAIGDWMFVRGVPLLPSIEVALLTLSQTVIAPVLVWAMLGEVPTALAMVGGAIVVAALAAHQMARVQFSSGRTKP